MMDSSAHKFDYHPSGDATDSFQPTLKLFTGHEADSRRTITERAFDQAVIDILLTNKNLNGYRNNDSILRQLEQRDLTRGNAAQLVGSNTDAVLTKIGDAKNRFIDGLREDLSSLYEGVYGDDTKLKIAIKFLRRNIDVSKFKLKDADSRQLLANEITRKLTFGYSEELFIDSSSLAKDLAAIVKEKYITGRIISAKDDKAILASMERFIRLEVFGAESKMFINNTRTPPTFKDLRCAFYKNLNESVNSKAHLSPSRIRRASPWLFYVVAAVAKTTKTATVAQIMLDVFDSQISIQSNDRDMRKSSARKAFFEEELDKAKQDPRRFSRSAISRHSKSLRKICSSNGEVLSSDDTVIALMDEFYPGGCSDYFKDAIRSRNSIELKKRMVLKYLDPSKGVAYYQDLLDLKAASKVISDLKTELQSSFYLGESVSKLAARYGVSKKGIQALYEEYSRTGSVVLTGSDNTTVILNDLEPNPEMLSGADLIGKFLNSGTIRLLRGVLNRKKVGVGNLPTNNSNLNKARELICNFEKNMENLNSSEIVSELTNIQYALMSSLDDGKKFVINRFRGSSRYVITDEAISDLIDLVDEISKELVA